MNNVTPKPALPQAEFVALMAIMTSLVALSIDCMLPALPEIGRDLQVSDANDNQLIISLLFLGMALGQLFFGPLSDSLGRKPAVAIGMAVFVVGSLLSIVATDFSTMLLGRILQGIGLGAPRTVSIALIRDMYQGQAMARVMSFIMTVFILAPMVAPAVGQAILLWAGWQAIFVAILLQGLLVLLWFYWRQPETLLPAQRVPFSLVHIKRAIMEVLRNPVALGYTLMAGFIFGAFLAYLASTQQLFQQQYNLGAWFPALFALLALAVGGASFTNSRLVMRFGMQYICARSLWLLTGVSLLFCVVVWQYMGHPPLWLLVLYFLISLFCTGLLFGNINALAMEPLGHIAGVGAAVVGSLSTLISVPLAVFIGGAYQGSVQPLVMGFGSCAAIALLLMRWTEARRVS
ncbi:multidrug effflux MFS transporter [Dasania marina]|uniref:multidrug effflux MFS transporter n=1 Tax=Dasania marina TaxID=471499 RepID=UPI0030DC8DFE